jgi:signal transduction histidine kinase
MSTAGGKRPRRGRSLRTQLAWVIAVLSGLPNLVLVGTVLLPSYSRTGSLTTGVWLFVLAWLAAVIAVSVFVGYALSAQLLAPLSGMAADIEALPRAAPGARLRVSGREPREVLALKRAFNAMLQEVRQEQARRSSFTAALMHDLKTPLIAANHLLNVVRDNEALTREQRIDVVSRLSTENQALIDLVQKMVDAHRLELEDVPLTREATELQQLVGNVLERLRPLARERGVEVSVQGEARANVDRKELERALYNLISNAVRYARSRIEVEVFPGMVRISDDGPGLPQPLERLAQPFNGQPVEIAGQRFTAGTGGLGLFIARRVLEAHGGSLVTESTGDRGSVLLAYLGGGAS